MVNISNCFRSDESISELWSKSGDSGDEWYQGSVTFTPTRPYNLVFEGEVGSDHSSDAALDDIEICIKDIQPCTDMHLFFKPIIPYAQSIYYHKTVRAERPVTPINYFTTICKPIRATIAQNFSIVYKC